MSPDVVVGERLTWPEYARCIIEAALRGRTPTRLDPPAADAADYGGAFVTLRLAGRVRGCMGILDSTRPVAEAVREAAISAALQDPRFPPVTPAELRDLRIEVSILSPPRPMRSLDELEIGRHGVIVRRATQRGLFLPQVARDHQLDRESFLSRCCTEKAGLPAAAWRDPDSEVLLFTTQVSTEPA